MEEGGDNENGIEQFQIQKIESRDDLQIQNMESIESVEDEVVYRHLSELTEDEILGLEFSSVEEAEDFYENYARCKGFVSRKHVRDVDKMKNIVMREMVCNREGEREKKHIERDDRVRQHRDKTRTNCKARIHFRLDKRKGKWTVGKFEGTHNHGMTSSNQIHLHPKYRVMTEADKAQVDSMRAHGVRPCQIMSYMMGQKGGHAYVGFLKKDVYNHNVKRKREKKDKGDADATMWYFKSKINTDRYHFAMYTEEEDGSLGNMYWADGCSRTDYRCFGDVLSFDSTYRTNKYNRPLVIMAGSNNHGGTTVFGCAVLKDEKSETYKWLLEVFVKGMYGKKPKAVVTDGDGAMKDAIKAVFPNACHRLCAWHLNKNAGDHVKNKAFLDDFNTALYANFSVAEFERFWESMTRKHGVDQNPWVLKTYENKKMWASAYMREKFFAGVRTTSRCEGIHSFIDKYVVESNCMIELVVNMERALKEYRHNELIADFKTNNSEPVLSCPLTEIEQCAANTYTRDLFKEVRIQIENAGAHNVDNKVVSGDTATLMVNRYRSQADCYEVIYNTAKCRFICQCRLFETRGIPCAHIFAVLRHEHIPTIPSSLILNRWTKNAKAVHIRALSAEESELENGSMLRFAALSADCNTLCQLAAQHTDDFNELQKELWKLTATFLKRTEEREEGGKKRRVENVIGDPNYVKTKGCPRRRKNTRRRRKCSGCGRRGHYISTCTKRKTDADECNSENDGDDGDKDSDDEMSMGESEGNGEGNGNGDVERKILRGESSQRKGRPPNKGSSIIAVGGQLVVGGFGGTQNADGSENSFDLSSSAMELLKRVEDPNWGKGM